VTAEYRRATSADAEMMTALRAVMVDSIVGTVSTPDDEWWPAATRWFAEHLGDARVAGFIAVVDGGGVASVLGLLHQTPPSPRNPTGLTGHLSSVATHPGFRRQGHSRRMVTMVLDWFDTEGAGLVELNATADGDELYRSLGFGDHPEPYLRRLRPDPRR
jgi:GNAT superfamily N-acetyltransferase